MYIIHFEAQKGEPKQLHFEAQKGEPKILHFEAQKKEPIKFGINNKFKLEVEK